MRMTKVKRRCLGVLLTLCMGMSGCREEPVRDRVEWPVMGTVAAVQTRSRTVSKEALFWIKNAFHRTVEEFDYRDPNSIVNCKKRCSDFGQPCWDFAQGLKEATGGAFDPAWRKNGRLDFGAVAKGFAVDVAAETVRRNAAEPAEDLLIDLGGNLKAVKGDWRVGVKDGAAFVLKEGAACATSACYFRGNHIADGRTGQPVTNGLHSVTVIHPSSAMVADGLSTVLFILGKEKGEAFLRERYPEAKAIWIDAGL